MANIGYSKGLSFPSKNTLLAMPTGFKSQTILLTPKRIHRVRISSFYRAVAYCNNGNQ